MVVMPTDKTYGDEPAEIFREIILVLNDKKKKQIFFKKNKKIASKVFIIRNSSTKVSPICVCGQRKHC